MHLVYINPNATKAMTDSVVAVAAQAAPLARITGMTNAEGPASIEGPEDGEAAVLGVLKLVAMAQAMQADAIVIACFDDTGLTEARNIATCPVLGIGHSAYTLASLMGGEFCVVTSVEESVPVLEDNISASGFARNCASVEASGLAVLTIEKGEEDMLDHLSGVILKVTQQSKCRTVILGCAGMAVHLHTLSQRTKANLIDGVTASAHLAIAACGVSAGSTVG